MYIKVDYEAQAAASIRGLELVVTPGADSEGWLDPHSLADVLFEIIRHSLFSESEVVECLAIMVSHGGYKIDLASIIKNGTWQECQINAALEAIKGLRK